MSRTNLQIYNMQDVSIAYIFSVQYVMEYMHVEYINIVALGV